MLAGLPVAIALLVQVSGAPPHESAEPAAQAPSAKPPHSRQSVQAVKPVQAGDPAAKVAERCSPAPENVQPGEIVVCAERPQGYRIDPDVLEASRAKRSGRLKRPERMKDNSCASVGPFGCNHGAGIDLLGAAMVLGTMATKAVRGENVGEMFITDPQPTEYDLYVAAKRAREAKEAEAASKAKAKTAVGTSPSK